MKNLILTAAIVFTLTSHLFSGEPDKKLHEECLYPTVMVCGQEGYESGYGSGVIIKSEKDKDGKYLNYVATCDHVVLIKAGTPFGVIATYRPCLVKVGNYENWSTFKGYTEYKTDLVYKDKEHDLAILVFESDKEMPTAEIDQDVKLYIGNDVMRVGCGLGDVMRLDFGKITSTNFKFHDKSFEDLYRTSVPTIFGDSGGPLFHKVGDDYKLVGITQAIRSTSSSAKVPLSHGYLNVPLSHPLMCISSMIPITKLGNWKKHCQKKSGLKLGPSLEIKKKTKGSKESKPEPKQKAPLPIKIP